MPTNGTRPSAAVTPFRSTIPILPPTCACRRLPIGYTIPKKKLGDICEITLSLVGRNLWMIYNKAPYDPETVATVNSYYQGIDYFMSPSTRNIGFNLRLKF